MFKLNTKFDADFLFYTFAHFEYHGHTVHMLTQQSLLPVLTSTVKLSLFMHEPSSPLSLAARLHQCCTNRSCYINNGWTDLYTYIYIQQIKSAKIKDLKNNSHSSTLFPTPNQQQFKRLTPRGKVTTEG